MVTASVGFEVRARADRCAGTVERQFVQVPKTSKRSAFGGLVRISDIIKERLGS